MTGDELSLLCAGRLKSIRKYLALTNGLHGDTAEVGIAAGGTSRMMALHNNGKTHWACDTFDGLMDCGPKDIGLTDRMFQNVIDSVVPTLSDLNNVRMVAGYFPESAGEMRDRRFSFVHIDVDTYQSVLNCFAWFSQRMVKGGVIALDDVLPKGSGCPGAQRAWVELLEGRKGWSVIDECPPQVVVRFDALA